MANVASQAPPRTQTISTTKISMSTLACRNCFSGWSRLEVHLQPSAAERVTSRTRVSGRHQGRAPALLLRGLVGVDTTVVTAPETRVVTCLLDNIDTHSTRYRPESSEIRVG